MDEAETRALIEARITEVERSLSAGEETAPIELDQTKVGRLSRMDAMQAEAMNAETRRRRRVEVSRLRGALQRLDGGSFGECIGCGDDIADKRLRHDPSTLRCIDCARRAER